MENNYNTSNEHKQQGLGYKWYTSIAAIEAFLCGVNAYEGDYFLATLWGVATVGMGYVAYEKYKETYQK